MFPKVVLAKHFKIYFHKYVLRAIALCIFYSKTSLCISKGLISPFKSDEHSSLPGSIALHAADEYRLEAFAGGKSECQNVGVVHWIAAICDKFYIVIRQICYHR